MATAPFEIDQMDRMQLIRHASATISAGASNDIMLSRLYTALVRHGERPAARLVLEHISTIAQINYGYNAHSPHSISDDWITVETQIAIDDVHESGGSWGPGGIPNSIAEIRTHIVQPAD